MYNLQLYKPSQIATGHEHRRTPEIGDISDDEEYQQIQNESNF